MYAIRSYYVRYTALLKAFPADAAELFKASEDNAKWRYSSYKRLAELDYKIIE